MTDYYDSIGVTKADLDKPECWECGAATATNKPRATYSNGVEPVLPLLTYSPYCVNCSEQHLSAGLAAIEIYNREADKRWQETNLDTWAELAHQKRFVEAHELLKEWVTNG